MSEDRIRVLRILEYEGPRSAVEKTLARTSGVPAQGEYQVPTYGEDGGMVIRSAILGTFPEVLKPQ